MEKKLKKLFRKLTNSSILKLKFNLKISEETEYSESIKNQ